jgi:hypothetical protein
MTAGLRDTLANAAGGAKAGAAVPLPVDDFLEELTRALAYVIVLVVIPYHLTFGVTAAAHDAATADPSEARRLASSSSSSPAAIGVGRLLRTVCGVPARLLRWALIPVRVLLCGLFGMPPERRRGRNGSAPRIARLNAAARWPVNTSGVTQLDRPHGALVYRVWPGVAVDIPPGQSRCISTKLRVWAPDGYVALVTPSFLIDGQFSCDTDYPADVMVAAMHGTGTLQPDASFGDELCLWVHNNTAHTCEVHPEQARPVGLLAFVEASERNIVPCDLRGKPLWWGFNEPRGADGDPHEQLQKCDGAFATETAARALLTAWMIRVGRLLIRANEWLTATRLRSPGPTRVETVREPDVSRVQHFFETHEASALLRRTPATSRYTTSSSRAKDTSVEKAPGQT